MVADTDSGDNKSLQLIAAYANITRDASSQQYQAELKQLAQQANLWKEGDQQDKWLKSQGQENLTADSEFLQELNRHLLPNVFVIGNDISVADLVLYSQLHALVESLNDRQRLAIPNVVRWFDNIQHLPQLINTTVFNKVRINQNLTVQNAQEQKPEKKSAPAPVAQKEINSEDTKTVPAQVEAKSQPPEEVSVPTEQPKETSKEEQKKPEQPKRDKKEQPKREKKPQEPKPQAKGKVEEKNYPDIAHLDIRVGIILDAHKHPEADKLYVEKIDLGEEEPRTIVSGLVQFVPLEEMLNRKVVVLCNLKPKKTRGVESAGMVLCSKREIDGNEVVEPLSPPADSVAGDRIFFPGFEGEPDPVLNPKKKHWENTQPELKTNKDRVAVYKEVPFTTQRGVVTSPTIAEGSIS
jgi:aminoacyl tRNA synthase complex-interacting multifunctional protein 1